MFENQIATLTTILKDKDIHNYMGDTFWNIIKAVSLGDIGALLDSSIDIRSVPAEKGKEISAKRTVHIYRLF